MKPITKALAVEAAKGLTQAARVEQSSHNYELSARLYGKAADVYDLLDGYESFAGVARDQAGVVRDQAVHDALNLELPFPQSCTVAGQLLAFDEEGQYWAWPDENGFPQPRSTNQKLATPH